MTWSVAEGSRGRRWREVVVAGEGSGVRSSLLLELDPDGRFSHLELSTAAGLLTLHPEGDGTIHGNAVTTAGVTHVIGLPWAPDDIVLVDGSTVCLAATPADGRPFGSLRISLDLELRRTSEPPDAFTRDHLGLPRLDGGTSWPLERDG